MQRQPQTFATWLAEEGNKIVAVNRGLPAPDMAALVYELLNKPKAVLTDNEAPYVGIIPTLNLTTLDISLLTSDITLIIQTDIVNIPINLMAKLTIEQILILPYGFTTSQWEQINKAFYTPFIIYGLIPRTLDLYLDKIQVEMSRPQQLQYLELLPKNYNSKNKNRQQLIPALEASNFVYPSQYTYNPKPDLPVNEGGWLTEDIVKNLIRYSPKFYDLVKIVGQIGQWILDKQQQNNLLSPSKVQNARIPANTKVLIFTSFNHKFGLDLVDSILRIDYNFSSYLIASDSTIQQINQTTEQFNNDTSAILILNPIQLPQLLHGVTAIFIVEGTEIFVLDYLLKVVFDQRNYSKPTDVSMHFMISMSSHGSIDNDYTNDFIDLENDRKRAFIQVSSQAAELKADKNGNFIVV